MPLVTFLVEWPITCLGCCYLFLIGLTVVMGLLGMAGLSANETRDYLVWDSDMVTTFDEYTLIRDYVEKYGGVAGSFKPLQT